MRTVCVINIYMFHIYIKVMNVFTKKVSNVQLMAYINNLTNVTKLITKD